MKLHESAIKELKRIFQIHGGHREEWRLASELSKIDFWDWELNGDLIEKFNDHMIGKFKLSKLDTLKKSSIQSNFNDLPTVHSENIGQLIPQQLTVVL